MRRGVLKHGEHVSHASRHLPGLTVGVGLLVLAISCHHDLPGTAGAPETSSAAAVDALPPSVGPSTCVFRGARASCLVAATSPPSPPDAALVQDARRVVLEWSDALDRHDQAALERVYAERVRYYGHGLPRSAVLQAKMAALRVNSTFRQEVVGEVEVAPDDDASLVARFLKRSGPAGKVRDVRAKVVIRQVDGGALLVVEETDEVTENVGVAGWRNECEATASRVVNELPEVKRVEDDARNAAEESDGQARFGDLGPIDDDTHGGFSVGIGIHTDERFQPEIWYSVDPAGHLSVTVLGADATVSPSSLRAVERVCKR